MEDKNANIIFNVAQFFYILFLGVYLIFSLIKCFSPGFNPVGCLLAFFVICGLLPEIFIYKGYMWARYFIGVFSALICLVLLLLPLTLHAHEKTTLFYFLIIVGIFIFGFNAYLMLIHKHTKKLIMLRAR